MESHSKVLNENLCSEIAEVIRKLTHSGQKNLDQKSLKKLKSICKQSDDYVERSYSLLKVHLEMKHSEIRRSAFQICDELFRRSHRFRCLLLDELEHILELTIDVNSNKPLPLPKSAAEDLKRIALRSMKEWNAKYGRRYAELEVGFQFLLYKKKVDFENLVIEDDSTRERRKQEEHRREMLDKSKCEKIKNEIKELQCEIESSVKCLSNSINLLVPTLDEFFINENGARDSSMRSTSVRNTFCDSNAAKDCSKSSTLGGCSSNKCDSSTNSSIADVSNIGGLNATDLNYVRCNENDLVVGVSNDDYFNVEDVNIINSIENDSLVDVANIVSSNSNSLNETNPNDSDSIVDISNTGNANVEDPNDIRLNKYDSNIGCSNLNNLNEIHSNESDSIVDTLSACNANVEDTNDIHSNKNESVFGVSNANDINIDNSNESDSTANISKTCNADTVNSNASDTAVNTCMKGEAYVSDLNVDDCNMVARLPVNGELNTSSSDLTENKDEPENQLASIREVGFVSGCHSVSVNYSVDKIDVEENEENSEIIVNARDQYKLLNKRYLVMVKRWVATLSVISGRDSVSELKKAITLKNEIEGAMKKYERLNIRQKNEDSDSEMEEVGVASADDILVSEIRSEKLELEKKSKRKTSTSSKSEKDNPILSKTEKLSSESKKLLSVAPKIRYDTDLYNWEEEDTDTPMIFSTNVEGGHFWSSNTLDGGNGVPLPGGAAALRTRVIEFAGTFEPSKWHCRAPLPNGKLCIRQDKYKCPFHGRIVARNAVGECVLEEDRKREEEKMKKQPPDWQDPTLLAEIEAATGVDLKMGKPKNKRKLEDDGLTKIESIKSTPYSRLAKKVFNKSSMKRVSQHLDGIDRRKHRDKFGDQFNYVHDTA